MYIGTLARLMGWNGRLMPIGAFTAAGRRSFPDGAAKAADTVMAWVGDGK